MIKCLQLKKIITQISMTLGLIVIWLNKRLIKIKKIGTIKLMINSIKIKETTESKTKKFILDKITKQKITFNLLLKLHRKSIYHNLKLLTYNNSIIILKTYVIL